jgi:hypothetical protein
VIPVNSILQVADDVSEVPVEIAPRWIPPVREMFVRQQRSAVAVFLPVTIYIQKHISYWIMLMRCSG